MYLLIGLGNPGKQYEKTRHNFGRITVQKLAKDLNLSWSKHKTNNDIAVAEINGQKVTLALPNTFMNESGLSVAAAAKFFKIKPRNIIVVYDDVAFDLGRIKVAVNFSSGGHNGIKSIIEHLGETNFLRVRLGIGPQKGKAEKYVLQKFSLAEQKKLPDIIKQAIKAIEMLVSEGMEKTANKFN